MSIRVTLFGESHGPAVGAVLEGFPAGFRPDEEALAAFLSRRASRGDGLTTARREEDLPEILSGIYQGRTCGTPITVTFRNRDAHSSDYDFLPDLPRPGHADYPALIRSAGAEDLRGGGIHSGRLTLPYCWAGGLALQLLLEKGIRVGSHLLRLGGVADCPLDAVEPDWNALSACAARPVPALEGEAAEAMEQALRSAAARGDSLGAVIECAADGLPAGLGGDFESGLKSRLGAALFSLPAVKAVEFGEGIAAAEMEGSAFNDPYLLRDGEVRCGTNHAGGLVGSMTTGMPLIVRAFFRPTPSVALPQRTVSLSRGEEAELPLKGRHDPCCALRALPAVEAAIALTLLDALLESRARTLEESR